MAPTYKLYYFDTTGRGELIRWIFAYVGQEFEDVRIQRTDWPALKANAPNGQLPYLEVNGKKLGQSVSIARFVARKHDMAGKDDWEAAKADALVDFVSDVINKEVYPIVTEQDEMKKLAMKEVFHQTGAVPYLDALERHLKANHDGEGFFVGDKPSWADFAVTFLLDMVASDSHLLDNHPLLRAHSLRVHDLKGIREWLIKHPIQAKI